MTTEVALIVGGGPGISASCARLFSREGMQVAVAARTPDKPVLKALESEHGVRCYPCDAREPKAVADLFRAVATDLGRPRLVVHNIDGRTKDIFRKDITEADPGVVLDTLLNSTYSAFLVGQQAAQSMLASPPGADGHRGTIIFTNASAAFKGYPKSGAFAMACHGNRVWPRVWRENSCHRASMSRTCRLTRRLGGPRRMVPAGIVWPAPQ
jgi:NAD(P)-dependent dehydrogenase (short-subunit alcohol dehydrogenase family)